MTLNYKSFGQGPPVIILHGLFGSLDNWQTLAKQLAEDFTVYIIDQRNHGRSPHTEEMSFPLAAEDLRAFMEDQWIYETHLIGHSMGGKTAMQFAFEHPDMLDRLVVVDISPKAYAGGHETIFEAMLSLDLSAIESRSDAEEQLGRSISDPGIRLFLLKNLHRTRDGSYEWKMNLPVLHEDYPNILSAVEGSPFEGPALFIRGSRSDYIQDADWPQIRVLFPQAKLETISGVGHWVHAEKPKVLLDSVRQFLMD
ncbi:MAG: alpha/beta fold hydrolase [Lewinella sp.]|nr:alpha/beta fold hydrolase [Lewinella sp.]